MFKIIVIPWGTPDIWKIIINFYPQMAFLRLLTNPLNPFSYSAVIGCTVVIELHMKLCSGNYFCWSAECSSNLPSIFVSPMIFRPGTLQSMLAFSEHFSSEVHRAKCYYSRIGRPFFWTITLDLKVDVLHAVGTWLVDLIWSSYIYWYVRIIV